MADDNPPRILVRPDALVFSAAGGAVVTLDRAGRLYSFFMNDRFYRRGVDGRVVEKFTRDRATVRRRVDPVRARPLVRRAIDLARAVPGSSDHPLIADLETDVARFRAAYSGPIPILPPDLYRALVLQATVGCAYNACRFCHLYRDRPFRARTPDEFARHAARVVDAFGAGLSMRRGIFLGDADALAVGTARLERLCALAAGVAPAGGGLFCFGAIFDEPHRPRGEWVALREAGLQRVYLGIETGHDPLRRKLNKPGTAADALRLVAALKDAGIAVGLIFLLGAGGEHAEAGHVRDSADMVRAAALGPDDFVYLSPLVTRDGRIAARDFRRQEAAIRAAVGPGPRVAVYDIRAFVY